MTSPALGIGYSLWLKTRWMTAMALVTLLIFAVASSAMTWAQEFILPAYLMVMVFELAVVSNAFVYGTADFGSQASSFPVHMMVLSASTWQLVGWPMIYCGIFYAIVWMVSAALLLFPVGFHPPLIWPATTAAAVVVWIQAVSWSPFPTPFAHIPAMVLAIAPLFFLGMWAGIERTSLLVPMAVTACNLLWILAAYGVGVKGLSRTRTGSQSDLLEKIRKQWWATIDRRFSRRDREKAPFRSMEAAQLWHECRRNVRNLPMMIAFIAVPMFPLVCLPFFEQKENSGLLIGKTIVTPAMLVVGIWISSPLMLSFLNAASFGKFDFWGKAPMSSFFATRPMRTTQYVIVKLKAAAIVAATCWAIILSLLVAWAALEASPLNRHESLIRHLLEQATPGSVVALLLGLAGLLFCTSRNLASGMWLTLCGRKWVANAIGFVTLGLTPIAGLIGWWIYLHREIQPEVMVFGPWILGAAVAVKLFAATAIFTALWHFQLIKAPMAFKLAAGWCVVASCFFAVICCFVSPTWAMASAVLLVVPLTSLAAAPLALFANRHR